MNTTTTNYKWLILYLLLNLGFHFVPTKMMVFPKDHFTFSNTIITSGDINSIIYRYNNAGITEKSIMLQDPLINKLFEKELIENLDIPRSASDIIPAEKTTQIIQNYSIDEGGDYFEGDHEDFK